MRRNTESEISATKSTRLMRTSMISMPKALTSLAKRSRTSCMILSRSPESTARTSRFVISSLNAACTTGLSRFSTLRMSTPLLRMNWRGSTMRHLISQSTSRLFLPAVKIGLVSGLSRVCTRLSRKTTFWNGGGSLNLRPGSVMTSLISPSA